MRITRSAGAAAVLVTGVLAAGVVPGTASTSSAAATGWYTGVCKGADAKTGTTVVVDFQKLNGNGGTAAATITRCSPNHTNAARTGLKALQDAGIPVVGTQRWGLAFVCRINGRPSATEKLPVNANPSYKEACVNTPPTTAYWSYWYADGKGRTWSYATTGAASHTAIRGGFEGWSFALNTATGPTPRVTPHNPVFG